MSSHVAEQEKPDWLKKREWQDLKYEVEHSIWTFNCKRSCGSRDLGFTDEYAPRLDPKVGTLKKRRVGYFTTDDVEEANQANADFAKKVAADVLRCDKEREHENERWDILKNKWVKNEDTPPLIEPTEPECDKPGIFVVSQEHNKAHYTCGSFVCVAKNEGDARMIHPCSVFHKQNACEYKYDELSRNEDWLRRNPSATGPAPGWFLGAHDSWVHGAYVTVKRISHYKPPNGKEPEFGIISRSFRSAWLS